MMFVGDSLQRGQWESFVCIVESVIPQREKSMKRGRVHNVFKAKVHLNHHPSKIYFLLSYKIIQITKNSLLFFTISLGVQRVNRILLGTISS